MSEQCNIINPASSFNSRRIYTSSIFFRCDEMIVKHEQGAIIFSRPDIDYRGKLRPVVIRSKNTALINFQSMIPPGKYFFEDDGDEDSRTILFDEP